MRWPFLILVTAVLGGCTAASEVVRVIKSPSGDVTLTVKKSDLGACCASLVQVSGNVFGQVVEDLAEIRGSGDVRYKWTDPASLSIVACNAIAASFRSGFQNHDYQRRSVLSVENERPSEDGDRVVCSSDRFRAMAPL